MKVKEESEKTGLKLNVQKTKTMASGPITLHSPVSVCFRSLGPVPRCPWPLPPVSADCSQPLDVVLLLDGSSNSPASYFDEMKSFAKAFISKANLGE